MDLLIPETGLLIWSILCLVFISLTFYIMILLIKLLRKKLRE